MYQKNKEGEKERREDMKRLWDLLHSDNESFSENIEWFGRKAIESEVHRSVEIMFATYLSIMIKVDNRLFLGRTYWSIKSRRVARVYRLLMTYGYAERIMDLALGAANLYMQTKHDKYHAKMAELRQLIKCYKLKVDQHRQKYDDVCVRRKEAWEIIRVSNRIFAQIYDIVESGTMCGWKSNTYFKILEEPSLSERLCDFNYLERFLQPRKYRWENFLSKFKPQIRNKRKKIDWTKI